MHKHTQQPIVTGTSVLAVKYKGGVMMSADTQGSYGSMARYKDLRRIQQVADTTLVGAGGEYSDFQQVMRLLEEQQIDDLCLDDGRSLTSPEIHTYLTRVMYNRRNKFNPLWNNLVIAGCDKGKAYLGTVDLIGASYEDDHIATGFGAHLARPLMRDQWHKDLSEGEAYSLLTDCMKVLFYRDCRAMNRMQLAKVEDNGKVTISDPFCLETKWDYQTFINPKAGAEFGGSW